LPWLLLDLISNTLPISGGKGSCSSLSDEQEKINAIASATPAAKRKLLVFIISNSQFFMVQIKDPLFEPLSPRNPYILGLVGSEYVIGFKKIANLAITRQNHSQFSILH
jgi:hypothetical protein